MASLAEEIHRSTGRKSPSARGLISRARVPWRVLRLFVLGLLLIAGGAAAFQISVLLQERANSMARYVRVDAWAVQQTEYELQQFRAIFARHVAGESHVTMDVVRERLAHLRSTVPLLRRGNDYQEFRILVDIDGAAEGTSAAIEDVGRVLAGRANFRNDLTTLRVVERLLSDPADTLRQLAVDVAHIRLELQDGDLENMRWLAGVNSWMLIGFSSLVILFIAFLVSEINAARRAEAEADVSWKRLKEAVERIHEGFALYDKNDRLVLANSQYRRMILGTEDALPPGSRFVDHMRACAEAGRIPEAHDQVEDWLRQRMSHHKSRTGVHETRLDDGTHLQVTERETFEGGTVAVYGDVTELKQREQSLQTALYEADAANRSKTEFLANMSHELRTPLNAIIGFSEIISCEVLGPIDNPTYKDYASDISASGKHLLTIVNEILDVSKIEAGEFPLMEEEFEIGAAIDAVGRMMSERAKRHGLEMSVDRPDVMPKLFGDERAVKQVLLNLLSNAIKFTPDCGSIAISGKVHIDGSLVIQVTDTGIGIAEEDIPRAMAIFGQVDSKLERQYEGTGLGLPLALNMMKLHGGTLHIDSEPGSGTIVTVRFPPERVIVENADNPDA